MRRAAITCHRDEAGQMAIAMILTLLVVFICFALAFDAGLWYFDHRTAQNQAEAAALAAAQLLPTDAAGLGAATTAAEDWLARNGAARTSPDCPAPPPGWAGDGHVSFHDSTGDGKYDTVKVCVRRQSNGIFSALSRIDFVYVSATATAMAGPVDATNVLPWGVVAPDPTCTEAAARNCRYDANHDGDYTDPGDCDAPFSVCPFGLTADRLYTFKAGTGGNTGILRVCGPGANDYRDCLAGAASSGFFQAGTTVNVDLQGGTIANATNAGLQSRAPAAAWKLPGAQLCDVASTPLDYTTQSPGYDPDGKALAATKFVNPSSNPQCAYRLVPIPIVSNLPPNGGGNVGVVGVASFGVARWNSTSAQDKYIGSGSVPCYEGPNNPPPTAFGCGVVWGYLFTGVTPPDSLLEQIGDTNNPFAPILIALVD